MQLYIEAAEILESGEKTSLKSAIFNNNSSRRRSSQPARLYALVSETIKFQSVLQEVIEKSGILKAERKLTFCIALLFAHDYLFTKQGIASSSGPLKDAFMRHKTRISAEFSRARLRQGFSSTAKLVEAYNLSFIQGSSKELRNTDNFTSSSASTTSKRCDDSLPNPRWVRVNTLKTTLRAVLESPFLDRFLPTDTIASLFSDPPGKLYFEMPNVLPNIFAIHPSHKIITSPLYIDGSIILQSASSCLPALLLNPPPGAHVIDTCAAPGNKTTHLAAIINNKGSVTAVEKDRNRSDVLEAMVRKAGASESVNCLKNTDFMAVDPSDPCWGDVEYLLLDPSCSGSGILNRMDAGLQRLSSTVEEERLAKEHTGSTSEGKSRKRRRVKSGSNGNALRVTANNLTDEHEGRTTEGKDEDRLSSLSSFQLSLIMHAFTFPSAKRITYSTCSIHNEENELVVEKALSSDIAKARGWTVESRNENTLKSWERRGNLQCFSKTLWKGEEAELRRIADGCVRVDRGDGLGGGFFVVCFVSRGCNSKRSFDSTTHALSKDVESEGKEGERKEQQGICQGEEVTSKRKGKKKRRKTLTFQMS